jgi:selenide,water dikinase
MHGVTDITGFGLLGHASEMAAKSNVGIRLEANAIPLLPEVEHYAKAGLIAGGLGRNRDYFAGHAGGVRFDPSVDPLMQTILFDPQTSGGLLIAIAADRVNPLRDAFSAAQLPLWHIGAVIVGAGIDVVP